MIQGGIAREESDLAEGGALQAHAARTLSLGPALCARLEAARAPMYDSRALSEIDGLKTRIEATATLLRSLGERWEEAGDAEEGRRARGAADALVLRMRTLLSTL